MATEQEYGEHLQDRIAPLITGVGPVESAGATAHALAVLAHRDSLPDLVFSLGSAGSRHLDHAGIYQLASVAYRDMDCTAIGFDRGLTPFLDLPAVIDIPQRIPGIPAASISTGADIVSGGRYDAIAADMVDMESFAVMRAAHRFGLPMIGLRGITDGKSEVTRFEDWSDYLHIVDERLAAALDAFTAFVDGQGEAIAAWLAESPAGQ